MRNFFIKALLILFAVSAYCNLSFGQAISSISPNHAFAGDTLTTTITISGITFTPGSPMGGNDIWLQNSDYDVIYSNFGSASLVDSNHVQVSWSIPNYATPGVYDLEMDALYIAGQPYSYTYALTNAFDVCSLSVSTSFNNTTCGNSNGAINVTINSGVPPYSYNWSNSATTQNLTNLAQGIYTVTVTDAYCSTTETIDVGNTNGPSLSDTYLHAICANADGSITVTVSAGTVPYTYSWNNGATTQNLTNLLAGRYTLTVDDHNNCENFLTVQLPDTNDLFLTGAAGRYSCNYNTGNIVVTATGTPPYRYQWSNGSTGSSIINVPSGDYTVTVTDALGCSNVDTTYNNSVFNGNAVFNYYVYLSPSYPNCRSNGSITALTSGGVFPYSYLWSNGQTAQIDTGLSGGSYYVTVTDSTGCERTGSVYLYSNCFSVISGKIFNDVNQDCIFDSNDVPIPNVNVIVTEVGGGAQYFGYTDLNGNYSIGVYDPGTFIIVPGIGEGSTQCGNLAPCAPGSNSVTFGSLGDTIINNYGFTASTGFDLDMHPGWYPSKPGFDIIYWVMPFNASPTPFNDTATVVFHYDPRLTYISGTVVTGTLDSVAHTLTWKFPPPLPDPNFSFQLRPTATFLVPDTMSVNDNLVSNFYIYPFAGDCDTSNNHFYYSDNLLSSHDPNSKQVSPAGGLTSSDTVLTYTIHFQNTGTDTTNFIIVKDTLSPNLNPASVRNLASSNNYTEFSISGQGILTWVFNPIYLVDSATNAPASAGFIIFSVKTLSNLPPGTGIENKATVYFDYNSGVVTNTVSNQVQFATGVPHIGSSIKIYPNPTTDNVNIVLYQLCQNCMLSITDVVGREMMSQPLSGKQTSIDLSNFAAGVYYIRVSTAKETETAKVVKQ